MTDPDPFVMSSRSLHPDPFVFGGTYTASSPHPGHLCRFPTTPPNGWYDFARWACPVCDASWVFGPGDAQWILTNGGRGPEWAYETRVRNERLGPDDDGVSELISDAYLSYQRTHQARATLCTHTPDPVAAAAGLAPDLDAYHDSDDLGALTRAPRPVTVNGRDVTVDVGHWVRPGEHPDRRPDPARLPRPTWIHAWTPTGVSYVTNTFDPAPMVPGFTTLHDALVELHAQLLGLFTIAVRPTARRPWAQYASRRRNRRIRSRR